MRGRANTGNKLCGTENPTQKTPPTHIRTRQQSAAGKVLTYADRRWAASLPSTTRTLIAGLWHCLALSDTHLGLISLTKNLQDFDRKQLLQ